MGTLLSEPRTLLKDCKFTISAFQALCRYIVSHCLAVVRMCPKTPSAEDNRPEGHLEAHSTDMEYPYIMALIGICNVA